MDRRRWILLVFVVALIAASLDVYSNGVRILDHWANDFEVRFDDPSLVELPDVIEFRTFTYDADGVETLVLEHATGQVTIRGEETDAITIETEVRGMKPGEGQGGVPWVVGVAWQDAARVGGADGGPDDVGNAGNVEYELSPDGELKVTLHPEQSSIDDRPVFTDTHVTLPAHLAVDVTSGGGFVNLHSMRGPQQVAGINTVVNIVPAAAAPIDVSLTTGQLMLSIPRHVADYSLEATLAPGSISTVNVNAPLQRSRDGMKSVFSATLGNGSFPLEITGSEASVYLNMSD